MLVQVSSKARIGEDQFYCCKLKDLQDRLAGIDCDNPALVTFSNIGSAKDEKAMCLQLIYWKRYMPRSIPRSQRAQDDNLFDNPWRIHINAVDRKTHEVAKACLQDGGWATITDWIAAKISTGLPMGHSRLQMECDGKSISFSE